MDPTAQLHLGFLPVMPMCLGSAVLVVLVSLLTPPPSRATLDRYFPPKLVAAGGGIAA